MKKIVLRLIVGLLCIMLSTIGILFSSRYIFNIHEPSLLKWIPLLATFIGFYLAGLITRNMDYRYLGILFLSFLIFIPLDLFYFPNLLYLVFFAFSGLLISRKRINLKTKGIFASLTGLLFIYFLFSQPLIINQEGFGTDPYGNLINAKEVWNFNKFEASTLSNEEFINLENETLKLTQFKGKTIYLSLWATWCGPCLAEKPDLDKLKEEFKDHTDVVFIDISLDTDSDKWKAYIQENNPNGIQLLSTNEATTKANFQINSIPQHFIINGQSQYKRLRFIPDATSLLQKPDVMNKWINTERLVIEKKDTDYR